MSLQGAILLLLVAGIAGKPPLDTQVIEQAKAVWAKLLEQPNVDLVVGRAIVKAMKTEDKEVVEKLNEVLSNEEMVRTVGQYYIQSFSLLIAGLEKGDDAINMIRSVLNSEVKQSFMSQKVNVDFPTTTNNIVKNTLVQVLSPDELKAFGTVMDAFKGSESQ